MSIYFYYKVCSVFNMEVVFCFEGYRVIEFYLGRLSDIMYVQLKQDINLLLFRIEGMRIIVENVDKQCGGQMEFLFDDFMKVLIFVLEVFINSRFFQCMG